MEHREYILNSIYIPGILCIVHTLYTLDNILYLWEYKMYSENEILMTQRRLREFSTVTIDDRSMTNRSSIVTELNSRNIMKDQICSRCILITWRPPPYLCVTENLSDPIIYDFCIYFVIRNYWIWWRAFTNDGTEWPQPTLEKVTPGDMGLLLCIVL